MARIEPVLRENLMLLVRAYIRATGVTIGSLSRRVHSDSDFFGSFQRGKVSVTLRKYDEMIAWFEKNWPADVERPVLQEVFCAPK